MKDRKERTKNRVAELSFFLSSQILQERRQAGHTENFTEMRKFVRQARKYFPI